MILRFYGKYAVGEKWMDHLYVICGNIYFSHFIYKTICQTWSNAFSMPVKTVAMCRFLFQFLFRRSTRLTSWSVVEWLWRKACCSGLILCIVDSFNSTNIIISHNLEWEERSGIGVWPLGYMGFYPDLGMEITVAIFPHVGVIGWNSDIC